ncbi:MAG: tyrosine-type recombinase/integrase [Chitinophagaceae bacterium]|nr:tyrosine-type recombinase/integrase [Chitinophagaceae bacterium]
MSTITITLNYLYHNNQECISIHAPLDATVNQAIHTLPNRKYSKTNQCWYILLTKQNYHLILEALQPIATINNTPLKEHLINKKQANNVKNKLHKPQMLTTLKNNKTNILYQNIAPLNRQVLPALQQQLQLKGYSEATIRTYTNEMVQFLTTLQNTPANRLSINRIKDYLQYCLQTLKLSEATLHSRINALKFYYEQVLKSEKFFIDIPRPKRPLQLPKTLSKEKIANLINSIENMKHKTIIMLAYACGLRVSEVISLKIKNIDSVRRLLFIEKAKGKKDRVVSLGPSMLIMLREYYKRYLPKNYLFEGQFEESHISSRSIQIVLQKAKLKAGIHQEGSMHMLRHSFATHLLDKGIDVVFIQKMLGHNDIKTTLKYLHVTNKDLVNIISPLEDIASLIQKT